MSIQIKATEQYFPVVLFIMLQGGLTFESVDDIIKCDQVENIEHTVFSVVLFIMLYKMVLTFEYVNEV